MLPGFNPRTWSGRPITLAIGWLMSCALVTAVTLTAVQRVGHEVSGSQPPVLSNEQVAQAAGQASVSASAASASASQHSRVPTPSPSPSSVAAPTSPPAQVHHSTKPSPRTTPTTSAVPSQTPPPPVSSTSPASPPASPPPSPSTSPSSPSSTSSPPAAPPSNSTSPTASPSSASPPAGTGKKVQYWSPDAPPAAYRGVIIFDCQGNAVVNLKAYLWQVPDQTLYTMTDHSISGQLVDVTFSKGNASTEYVWSCSNGTPVGGPVVSESP